MKFQVGDKVKVRTDLVIGSTYYMEGGTNGASFVPEMRELSGKQVTIQSIDKSRYRLVEDRYCYWTDDMFEEGKLKIDIDKQLCDEEYE